MGAARSDGAVVVALVVVWWCGGVVLVWHGGGGGGGGVVALVVVWWCGGVGGGVVVGRGGGRNAQNTMQNIMNITSGMLYIITLQGTARGRVVVLGCWPVPHLRTSFLH